MGNEYIPITAKSNYQTRYTMEIDHQFNSVMTELAVLPVHGISIHTAQYMFATLCELHAVPLHLTSKG